MNLGIPELVIIFVIVLLLFGPSKLPGLGKSLGEAIRGFKRGVNEDPEKQAQVIHSETQRLNPNTPETSTATNPVTEKDKKS